MQEVGVLTCGHQGKQSLVHVSVLNGEWFLDLILGRRLAVQHIAQNLAGRAGQAKSFPVDNFIRLGGMMSPAQRHAGGQELRQVFEKYFRFILLVGDHLVCEPSGCRDIGENPGQAGTQGRKQLYIFRILLRLLYFPLDTRQDAPD